ncbi:MAG: NAD-glutamate dehydrogenase [Victivallales bacterium]|nr:NAD-glutamate dehydrogenase [Victivallales bacterium]
MTKNKEILNTLVSSHSRRLEHWYKLLHEIMPDYFFKTFGQQQLEELLPMLFNIECIRGIQRIERNNSVTLVYLKNAENDTLKINRMMDGYNIVGAVIYESEQKLVINGISSSLVIEYYHLADGNHYLNEPVYSLRELQEEYKKRYGKNTTSIKDIYRYINWKNVNDLSMERLLDRLDRVSRIQDKDYIKTGVEKLPDGELRLTVESPMPSSSCFYFKLREILKLSGLDFKRIYFREITSNNDITDFSHKSVNITTLYLKTVPGVSINSPKIQNVIKEIPLISWVEMNDVFHSELVRKHLWTLSDANLIRATAEFIHSQFSYIDRSAYTFEHITRLMAVYEPLLKLYCKLFHKRFCPDLSKSDRQEKSILKKLETEIEQINTGMHDKDITVKNIFNAAIQFVNSIIKTNFYCIDKSALAFRLVPDFIDHFAKKHPQYNNALPIDRPHGVFFFYRSDTISFQVRFSEIARGGWRTVIPKDNENNLEKQDNYEFAKDEVFREVYVLAHTQHLKNKDIYEGGSKMITLLHSHGGSDILPVLYSSQRSICRAFLSLITYNKTGKLSNDRIVDKLGRNEIIEVGPDENMHDIMIKWMAKTADKSGYYLGSGFISGKPDRGINHKEFGVTSFGVHQFLLRTLEELNINAENDSFSVKISGGPSGDVAGNEMKLLLANNNEKWLYPNLKITAITDGPAVIYDPAGIDKNELLKLVLKNNLDVFNPEKLIGENAYMLFSSVAKINGIEKHRLVTVKSGKLQEQQVTRDEFMHIFQNNLFHYADIFIPCGGRPQTINNTNWQEFCPDGIPSAKAIIEGANSYITPEARNHLQDAGIIIIKDASANKCGVITSSYETLFGLMLNEEEFAEIKDELVKEVMKKLRNSARLEADWLFSQHKCTGSHLTFLTDQLSRNINDKNVEVVTYLEKNPDFVYRDVILSDLPNVLTRKYSSRLDKVPKSYQRAIASVEFATRIIYGQTGNIEDEIKSVSN